MTNFEKQAFKFIEPRTLICEEFVSDWEDGWQLVRFDLGICPINIDLWHAEGETFEEGKRFSLKLLLMPGAEFLNGPNEIFHDEKEYYRERTMKSMAAESIIPSGIFSPNADPNFHENASVILQAKFKSVEKVKFGKKNVLHLVLKMEGLEFDAFFDDGVLPFAEEGNVISAAFTAVGVLVKEEEK